MHSKRRSGRCAGRAGLCVEDACEKAARQIPFVSQGSDVEKLLRAQQRTIDSLMRRIDELEQRLEVRQQ